MTTTTIDCKGQIIAMGDRVRVLDITPDRDLDEEDLDMFMGMVGAVCDIERIDADGAAWVALCWREALLHEPPSFAPLSGEGA